MPMGDVGDDGAHSGHHEAGSGAADTLPHDLGDIGGEPGGHAVVARVPQGDGGQQEYQASFHRTGQYLAAAAVIFGQIPLGVLLLHRAVFLHQLGFPDGDQQHRHRQNHNGGYNDKKRLVVHMDLTTGNLCRVQQHADTQIEHPSHRTHQVNDSVGLGA